MISLPKRNHGKLLLARLGAAACILVACVALTHMAQAAFLDHQVKNMTAELKDLKMKTMCVGRFLIDVPADAEVSYRGAALAGWDIASNDEETDDQFAARLQQKETELANQKNEREMVSLEAVKRIEQDGIHGRIFMFGREWVKGTEDGTISEEQVVSLHAYVRAKNVSFSVTRNAKHPDRMEELAQLVTQLRPRAANEIPTEPGFCFDSGLIVEPLPAERAERTTMFVGLKGHPDVSIVLNTIAGITTPKTLFERSDKSDVRSKFSSRFHTFRRESRPFNGQEGEELLERVHETDGSYGHDFMWEPIHNSKNDVLTPLMSFEMSTGHGEHGTNVNSSLTDAEALALWDKLLSSLRVRPVQPAKSVAVAPVQVPLGTWAYANERCPQTGWWECTDGDKDIDILGGRQQYYRKGEGMAQAVQLVPTTLAQRLAGQQPTFTSEIPTPWKLVNRRQSPRGAPAATLAPATPAPVDDASTEPLRPGAQYDETTLQPGTVVDSGMVCPASGWWRCVDANALDGTRWFGRGQHVPMATVRQQLSTLERFKGALEVTHQRASWQFVRHDAGAGINSADKMADDESADKPT